MNRDELIDKLAMELGEWPATAAQANEIMPEGWYWRGYEVVHVGGGLESLRVHVDDWLQRRAELINKPSWDDAPEWATHLCQRGDGLWKWYPQEPHINATWEIWSHDAAQVGHQVNRLASHGATPAGHDWRQTLERRPITTSLGAAPMTPEEQELPSEERHDCDRCGGSWWSPRNTECPCQASRSDGSTASYYELPEGATELQDLISYRNLNSQDGEIFRAIYRKGRASHSDALRDAKKVLFYAKAEVQRLERHGK